MSIENIKYKGQESWTCFFEVYIKLQISFKKKKINNDKQDQIHLMLEDMHS